MSSIKALLVSFILATSYNVSAKDGAFTGTVNYLTSSNNITNIAHYKKDGTADKSHSGIVFTQKKSHLTFSEKLLSAADK